MMILAAQALYLFLPLLVAAALSRVVLRNNLWTCLKQPIDGGATVRGRRLFGDNKTWRGVACAVAGCLATVAVQKYVVGDRAGIIAVLPYSRVNVVGTMCAAHVALRTSTKMAELSGVNWAPSCKGVQAPGPPAPLPSPVQGTPGRVADRLTVTEAAELCAHDVLKLVVRA